MAVELKPGANWLKLKSKVKKADKSKPKTKAKKPADKTKALIDKITSDLDKKSERKDATSMMKFAEDNDIPLEDLQKSYGLPAEEVAAMAAISTPSNLSQQKKQLGKYLAIDCEFVGVGPEGQESALARVSIVNFHGHTVYDKFVKPRERVTDWRTWVSGVSPANMKDAILFKDAQKEVSDMLEGRVLIGHAVDHDLEALLLSHPKAMIRDTSRFPGFRKLSKGKTPALKKLAKEVLGLDIQGNEHSSVEDARATMMLYKKEKKEIEKWAAARNHRH